jgi:ribosomal protein S18 acetylase RimI-like enzyme
MTLSKISFEDALKSLFIITGCENYHDTLLGQSNEYLNEYQFFKVSENDIFGISPEKNIHLYSKNEAAILNFLQHLETIKINSKVIFSFYNNDSLIRNFFKSRKLTSKPFFYLAKQPIHPETLSNSLEARLATFEDQPIVDLWYKNFNEEELSSWATPDLSKNPSLKLYLLFLNSEFVGAAANTLQSSDRLWIGRLWIDPKARNQNLGTSIMKKLESVAIEENKTMSLLVANNNEKALALYTKLGYQTVSFNCYWY